MASVSKTSFARLQLLQLTLNNSNMQAIILTFAALVSSALAGGLSNSYLPPYHGSASSFAPTYTTGYSSGGFVQAASAPIRHYVAPAVVSYGHHGGYGSVGYVQAASAPVSHYSAPARTVVSHGHGGYSGGFNGAASAPIRQYAAPAVVSRSYGGYSGGYNGGYTAAAPLRHYAAPAVLSYAATAPVHHVAPAASYLPPAVHVGTHYAANGGYLRQK